VIDMMTPCAMIIRLVLLTGGVYDDPPALDCDDDNCIVLMLLTKGFRVPSPPRAFLMSSTKNPLDECCVICSFGLSDMMLPFASPVAQMKGCSVDEVSSLPPDHDRQFAHRKFTVILSPLIPDPANIVTLKSGLTAGSKCPSATRGETVTFVPSFDGYTTKIIAPAIPVPTPMPVHPWLVDEVIWKNVSVVELGRLMDAQVESSIQKDDIGSTVVTSAVLFVSAWTNVKTAHNMASGYRKLGETMAD
jgi:hypothetical protein